MKGWLADLSLCLSFRTSSCFVGSAINKIKTESLAHERGKCQTLGGLCEG